MPEFYTSSGGQKIPIIRRSLNEGFLRGMPDAEHLSTGAVPRDYAVDPVEMRDSPDSMVLIPESEYDARFDAGNERQDTLEHILLRGIERGEFEFLDQNGFPDCWYHSTAHAAMVACLRDGMPVPRLNAVAGATLLNRLNGAWSGLSMKHMREHGCPTVKTWPYQSRRGSLTPEVRADMAANKVTEDWYDLGRAEWDQVLATRQLHTCTENNMPAPSDYNRAGHAMVTLRRVRYERGAWGNLTLNSWHGFGYKGLCVLDESWPPDGACALRTLTPR